MKLTFFHTYVVLLLALTLIAAGSWVLPRVFGIEEPGLAPLRFFLAQINTVDDRPDVEGYERSNFGAWGTMGACSTREYVIAAQAGLPECEEAKAVADPYTGAIVTEIDVDHIFPLAAAWDLGASTWSRQRRVDFANDPRNLVAVDASSNREKSDSLPSQWLPPDPRARCWYVRRVAEIAAAYELALPIDDKTAMRRQCLFDLGGN